VKTLHRDRADHPPSIAIAAGGVAFDQLTEGQLPLPQLEPEFLSQIGIPEAHQAEHHLIEIGTALKEAARERRAPGVLGGLLEPAGIGGASPQISEIEAHADPPVLESLIRGKTQMLAELNQAFPVLEVALGCESGETLEQPTTQMVR
jgi:hypothetical protein